MKSFKKYILYSCIIAATIGIFSCKKVLDKNEDKSRLLDDTQWASEGNADIFINEFI